MICLFGCIVAFVENQPGPIWVGHKRPAERVTGSPAALTTRSGGHGPRRGKKAGMELGRERKTSLGRSKDSRPSRPCQSVPRAANAENNSPSSKTARFTGSGHESSYGTGWTGNPNRNTEPGSSSHIRSSTRAGCARCRHIPPISFSSGCRDPAFHTPRTCRRRAGSRDTCTPSTVLPTDSTLWLDDSMPSLMLGPGPGAGGLLIAFLARVKGEWQG